MIKLYPYQSEDVKEFHALKGVVLLASEMGLGKTIEICQYLKENAVRPAIIVCPASLKLQWQDEAWSKFGIKSLILSGQKAYLRMDSVPADRKTYIINYEILPYWLPLLRSMRPRIVVGDEVHRIGNASTKAYKSFYYLCKGPEETSWKVPHVFCVSGTPLTNRPWELFPILNVLWPKDFDSAWSYGMDYCECEGRSFGKWRFTGAKNLTQLHARLKELGMIRRTFAEVMPQLPPLTYSVVPMEIERPEEYAEAEADVIAWLRKYNPLAADRAARAERWTRFGYLKRLASTLSLRNKAEWLGNFLSQTQGDKILVGCIHRGEQTPVMPFLADRFRNVCVQIHGGVPMDARLELEKRFKSDADIRMMLGQIKAMGEGYNLPEANNVAMLEFPFTPGACRQFIKRAHRVTSTRPVNAYFLCAKGTIEEKLLEILQRKDRVLDLTLDGRVREDSLNVFDELQRLYLGEKK